MLPHYPESKDERRESMIHLMNLGIIGIHHNVVSNNLLEEVEIYGISKLDMYTLESIKFKVREYNLSKILESI